MQDARTSNKDSRRLNLLFMDNFIIYYFCFRRKLAQRERERSHASSNDKVFQFSSFHHLDLDSAADNVPPPPPPWQLKKECESLEQWQKTKLMENFQIIKFSGISRHVSHVVFSLQCFAFILRMFSRVFVAFSAAHLMSSHSPPPSLLSLSLWHDVVDVVVSFFSIPTTKSSLQRPTENV